LRSAEEAAREVLAAMKQSLEFAYSPDFGYLSASPYNVGTGTRHSAMLHLIACRGLFGESSRAVGAFVQASVTSGTEEDFKGAISYLLESERAARAEPGLDVLISKTKDALHFAQTSRSLSLPEALRVLGWVRWAASERLPSVRASHREADSWLTTLELRSTSDEERAARQRADFLRDCLDL
jgi:protein arginine kinase